MHTTSWASNPTVFEINTWVWLSELSEKYGTFVELGSIPSFEWDALAEFGFDAVWLMGVWERSPVSITIANQNQRLREDFCRALPDFHPLDNVGSPYCVRKHQVDELLGGPTGLAIARQELASRGMRLLLDFVPNHLAPDHSWVLNAPEYFIAGDTADIEADPASHRAVAGRIFACGRDPDLPAWPDVLQLNLFHPGLRQAMKRTILEIAGQCDGLRCDLARLILNPVFERTWGVRAGPAPEIEFWREIISAIKARQPDFLFMAEGDRDQEWELQQQGFDFCYDKRLYDRLEQGTAESVRIHLGADSGFQSRLVRFIENHEASRAAAVFPPARERCAAVVAATLPGAHLFHEGQFEGRRVKLPVFLGRRPAESANPELRAFYQKLLASIRNPVFHSGEWRLCQPSGLPGNPSFLDIVAWSWVHGDDRRLVVVNLSENPAQARIDVRWSELREPVWKLIDTFSGESYERSADEVRSCGLYVSLGPWGYHLFHCRNVAESEQAIAA